ncbi:regulator of chromosome condensation 1/beta-lactamase-inhibitor protein II [Hysterangium stoloniferum]|nr:regulator of chromosome condensation 1/beta-lactamase-inhibitor protein II [Hysterangium stoloniferum]
MTWLTDIPLEVLIDDLLPYVALESIPSLSATCKYLASVCDDDTFWKRKLKEDYNFSDSSNARTKGYKFLYRGVKNSTCYVWGLNDDNRLGLGYQPRQRGIVAQSVPYPKQLNVNGPRIVSLVASGWAFHALDSEGNIHVSGKLQCRITVKCRLDGENFSSQRVVTPARLKLPQRITMLSCGRGHTSALSDRNHVWIFTSWSQPYVLTSPLVSASALLNTPRQIESGWRFSAILVESGEVYVWWPFDGEAGQLVDAHSSNDPEHPKDGIIECQPWEVDIDPLPILDHTLNLPHLRGNDQPVGDKIVKIAAGDNFIVAITEGGHVLKVDFFEGIESFQSRLQPLRWQYLEAFSEPQHIRALPAFQNIAIPASFKITHISAHFLTFFAYSTGSSSIVLKGSKESGPKSPPDVIPSLQNNNIISVVLGDYHFGALTSTGKVLTWGAYSKGALGLGDPTQLPVGSPGGYSTHLDRERAKLYWGPPPNTVNPPDVIEPTEVKFGTQNGDNGREVFVFDIAASGWHTGALVIDMEVKKNVHYTYI